MEMNDSSRYHKQSNVCWFPGSRTLLSLNTRPSIIVEYQVTIYWTVSV